jgi:hypothetical protein
VREGLAAWIRLASADQGAPRPPPAEARLSRPASPGGVAGAIAALILSLPKEGEHGRE